MKHQRTDETFNDWTWNFSKTFHLITTSWMRKKFRLFCTDDVILKKTNIFFFDIRFFNSKNEPRATYQKFGFQSHSIFQKREHPHLIVPTPDHRFAWSPSWWNLFLSKTKSPSTSSRPLKIQIIESNNFLLSLAIFYSTSVSLHRCCFNRIWLVDEDIQTLSKCSSRFCPFLRRKSARADAMNNRILFQLSKQSIIAFIHSYRSMDWIK